MLGYGGTGWLNLCIYITACFTLGTHDFSAYGSWWLVLGGWNCIVYILLVKPVSVFWVESMRLEVPKENGTHWKKG